MLGIDSGRPTLQLQDLVVALRAFAPGQHKATTILCSIDPTEEGLARMQQFLRSIGANINPGDTQMIVDGMRTSLGMQNIRIGGISPSTHFAQVLLECDYRMKLIGIGLEQPPVRLASYVDKATPSSNKNGLERWFFIPDYNSVPRGRRQPGAGTGGRRRQAGFREPGRGRQRRTRSHAARATRPASCSRRASRKKFADMAARVPVFAEMRNVIDLSIVAAFINQQDFYAKADWRAPTFNDEKALQVETYQTPRQVETVCTAVWKGDRCSRPSAAA